MQTTTSAPVTPPDNLLDTTPSYAQLYQARQEDYDLLLSLLRDSKIPPEYLADTLIKPRPLSPMAQDNERGQIALQALIKDADYRALCKQLNASYSYLKVTIVEGRGVYETLLPDRATILPLVLTGQPKWSAWMATIDQAAQTLGGQIRFDSLVSVSRMAKYYGLMPWDPKNTTEHLATIRALEEQRARHSPLLENGIDIDSLYRRPTLSDRNTLKTIRNAFPPDRAREITAESIVHQLTDSAFIKVIKQHLPDAKVHPIDYLAGDILKNLTPQTLRESPSVYLDKILNTDKAQALANALIKALGWYASKPDEETSPDIRIKLVAKALRLWCNRASDQPDTIVGYNLNQRANWGKNYQTLQTEFEQHLLESGRALSMNEAILLGRLFLSKFPVEFQVQDIPTDLPFRSSLVWVNFVHGANVAHAIDPALLQLLKFQDLVNFPIDQTETTSTQALNIITLARLRPTLEWAVTNGVIREASDFNYTQEEIERSVSALDAHTQTLSHAITELDKEPPKRLELAKQEMTKLLGRDAFMTDGYRLIPEPSPWASSFFDVPTLNSAQKESFSFLDVYASGMFDDGKKWYRTTDDGKQRSQAWIYLDGDRKIQIYKNLMFTEASNRFSFYSPGGKYLPDIHSVFQERFNTYLTLQKTAYEQLIRSLLAQLPLLDRQAIEYGTIKIYTLRAATSGEEAQNETETVIKPLRARKGFIVEATHNNQTSYYECVPSAGVIRPLKSFNQNLIGGERTTEKWKVSTGPAVSVNVIRTKILPFDWNAHTTGTTPLPGASCEAIIEQLGNTLSSAQPDQDPDFVPHTLSSLRSQQITGLIISNLFFVDETLLLAYARGETEFDRIQSQKDKVLNVIKMFVPFWSAIEDIASGDRNRIIRGVFGLIIDVAAFVYPIGKYVSGVVKLVLTAGKLGTRATLLGFGNLTTTLLIATVQNLLPLDGIPSLLKSGSRLVLRYGQKGLFKVKSLAGHAGRYDVVGAVYISTTPGTWKPRGAGDHLATVRGIEDVPLRNTGLASKPDYHLIDPLSGKPYGPKLGIKANEISFGRSEYTRVAKVDNRAVFDLPKTTRVQHIPEVDGRSTLLIDDVPYRLDRGALRRVDTIDASETLKLQALPGSTRPGKHCLSQYLCPP
ncbi:hypothetical protein [Pseudomonas purpurea]|uniref:hypothetical protein n=1 Tax=Pseudomonas purpurea TaxID=3136737 RepID=UPI00326608B4